VDWHDWLRSDRTICVFVILIFCVLWYLNRVDKILDLVNLFSGALIALVTNKVLRKPNGGSNNETK
jgi:hypothetical protein